MLLRIIDIFHSISFVVRASSICVSSFGLLSSFIRSYLVDSFILPVMIVEEIVELFRLMLSVTVSIKHKNQRFISSRLQISVACATFRFGSAHVQPCDA
jgi:hypothetical protein